MSGGQHSTKLRFRLILAVATVHAVLMSLFVWDLTQRQRTMLLGQQTAQAETIARSLALASSDWAASDDRAGLQEIIESQRRQPGLEFVMILDAEGHILAHTERSRIGQYVAGLPAHPEHTVLSRSARLVDVVAPISLSDRQLGWVRLGLGQADAGAELRQITRRGIGYAAAAITLGVLFACLLGTRITDRLSAIRSVAGAVRRGAHNARVPISGDDELTQLATDFNGMLESLELKEGEIGRLNAELEQRVLQRTKELEDAVELNDQLIANATLGLNAFAADGQCVLGNDAASRIIGGSREQMLTQNFRTIGSWKVSGLLQCAEEVLASGMPQHRNFHLSTTYGREITLDGRLSRFVSRGVYHLLFAFVDITEHEKTEALRSQLSVIIERTSDFVAMASPDGTVCYLNGTARRMFGLGPQDDPSGWSIGRVHPADELSRILEQALPAAASLGQWSGETLLLDHTGKVVPHTQVIISHKDEQGRIVLYSTIARDISAQKHSEAIANARLHLLRSAPGLSTAAFLQLALDTIEDRTGSNVGFYHFMAEDQETISLQAWSTNTTGRMCTAAGAGQHYPISQAGIWADCVRERRPVTHNDYEQQPHRHGLPKGHAPVLRELTVPVLRGERIVAIVGVGNKAVDYDARDMEIASLLADFSWEVIEHKRAEERLATSEARFRELFTTIGEGFALHEIITDDTGVPVDYRYLDVNPAFERQTGIPRERWIGHTVREVVPTVEEHWITDFGAVALTREPARFIDYTAPIDRWFDVYAFSPKPGQFAVFTTDITERKRAEHALEAAQQQLIELNRLQNAVLDAAALAIISVDLRGTITTFSRGAEILLGYGREEMIGRSTLTSLHLPSELQGRAAELDLPDNEHSFFAVLVSRPARGDTDERERTLLRKDGSRLAVFESITALRDEHGATTGYLSIAQDLTERKRVLLALQASEERLQQVLDQADCLVWAAQVFLQGDDWNWQFNIQPTGLYKRLFGERPPTEHAGLWYNFAIPEMAEMNHRSRAAMESGSTGYTQVFRVIRDAQTLWIRESVSITRPDPTSYRLVGVATDVTDQKVAEGALSESLALLGATLQATADGILAIDDKGVITSYNQRYLDYSGVPAELVRTGEARQLLQHIVRRMHDAEGFLAHLTEIDGNAASESSDVIEFTDGRIFELCSRPQLLDARSVGRVWSFHDITAQRQTEAELKRVMADLTRSNTDLEQFAYVASHDLKSPLRAIESLAGWIQEDLEPVLTPDSRKHLGLLLHRTRRMERLLDDLLAYSRAGRVPADIVPVDVGRLVGEIAELIDLPAGFTVRFTGLSPVFDTAVTPLRTVLTNLIANAIKHHDRPNGEITVSACSTGACWQFSVADDGPGVPPEFRERIWGMFQTLRPRDEVEGSGIGLALVRRIVMHYGGTAAVESRAPRGSLFSFTWPKVIATTAPTKP